jgi:hypothetical protein
VFVKNCVKAQNVHKYTKKKINTITKKVQHMPSATYTGHEFKNILDLLNDIAMNLTKEPICAFTRDAKDCTDIRQIYFGHSSVPEPYNHTGEVEGDPSPLTKHLNDETEMTDSQKDIVNRLTNRNENVVIKFGNFGMSMFRQYSHEDGKWKMLNIELMAF